MREIKPTSFSQNNMFEKCARQWYYSYIKKIPSVSDLSYANAGTVVHKILERYYTNKTMPLEELKKEYKKLWEELQLHTTNLKNKDELYWGMVLNGVNLKKEITSTELKIFFEDAIAYLDCVNTKDDEISDWKTSTRTEENETEYKKQLMFYSYLYFRKFNKLPKRGVIHYLKYNNEKANLEYVPTDADLYTIEDWHMKIRTEMKNIAFNNKIPDKCQNCDPWCPYVNLCTDRSEGVVKFTLHILGNYIQLNGAITEILNKALTKKFSYELKNAHFIKKVKPMANTTIKFWNLNKRLLPIGFKNRLIKTLKDYADFKELELVLDVEDHRIFDSTIVAMPDKFLNGILLRDYQENAVTIFMRNGLCILQIATGAGKTEIAIECIRRCGVKTLFIVDKIELLRQTKERIEAALGVKVGQIGSGEDTIEDITVATIQTLIKHPKKYAAYLNTVKFAIFDECHKVAARSYWKLAHYLKNTKFRLGLSGTAYRDDGNDMMINAIVGDIEDDISSNQLIEKGWLTKPTITFIKNYMPKEKVTIMEQACREGLINETPDYNSLYEGLISKNTFRNDIVKNLIDKHPNAKILILTKLIDHGKLLHSIVPNSQHLYGDTPKEIRKEMFDNFVSGKNNVLVSTLSIFAEGIDIPSLDVIINAGANRGDVKTIQVLGRVLRTLEGKKNAYYYDFMDESRFFRIASLARKRALENEGHDVKIEG